MVNKNFVFSILSLFAVLYQLNGFLLAYCSCSQLRGRIIFHQCISQSNKLYRKLRHARIRALNRKKTGRSDRWWKNLIGSVLLDSEWRKNFRMPREMFIKLADEIRSFLAPHPNAVCSDVLTVEKQLAITMYFLKDQGSMMMVANTFGVAVNTVSVIVYKVRHILTVKVGP